MQNLGSALLIPQCDSELLLGDKSFPQGFANEYNFTTTKRPWELKFLEGKTGTFLFFPSKSNFLKSLLFYPTDTQSKGP